MRKDKRSDRATADRGETNRRRTRGSRASDKPATDKRVGAGTAGATDTGRPMSEIVRARIQAANQRYHANDNIAQYIASDAERDALRSEVESKVQEMLHALVIDTENDHNTQDTARRIAKMFVDEVFRGRYYPAPSITAFPNVERLNELLVIGPITVRSACSHHFCPIMGKLWVGVMPSADSHLIGLSKYARMADWVMSRPQIQEEAVKTLADILETRMQPAGVAVVMQAEHYCMHWRGVKDQTSMTSSVMRGSFLEHDALRREFLALLKRD